MKKHFTFLLPCCLLLLLSCKKQDAEIKETEPEINYSYNYKLAGGADSVAGHPISNEAARLGRLLFYDVRLSSNNKVSCGSCHKQELAFSDNVALSTGFNGGLTGRNSMPIINAIDAKGFFWDHRTKRLEDMVLQPIRHQVEMGLDNTELLVKKLGATSYYPRLFMEAFGSEEINKERMGIAMANFIYSMRVNNSNVDKSEILTAGGWNDFKHGVLTPDEERGAAVFTSSGCLGCHSGTNLRGGNDEGFENIGLDEVYADKGMGAYLNDPSQDGKFKIPSLRNVELTAPYMHDGRYNTLEEVIEHYNSGVKYSPNLSQQLRKYDPVTYQFLEEPKRLDLNERDKKCLVAFLKAMTDRSLVNDPKFSDPFKK